jgi:hypothetical protein
LLNAEFARGFSDTALASNPGALQALQVRTEIAFHGTAIPDAP